MLVAVTHRGYVRRANEDAALARALGDDAALLAVADGVGGYPGGELASAQATEAVEAVALAAPLEGEPRRLLISAVREADRRVRAAQAGAHAGMCTTLVVALVRNDGAWVANVGDSRAYTLTNDTLTQVTADHSWVEEEIRAGRLRREDPRAAAQRHVITRVIGAGTWSDVDVVGPLPLARGDALLLCSDGLHGYVEDGAIRAALAPPDAHAADRLVALALAHGGMDNVAVSLCVRD